MLRITWNSIGFALSTALALGACGASATDLQPKALPAGHGAVFGHVQVFKGDSEVTGSCYIEFTDENEEDMGSRSLDDSGWVFTTLPEGKLYLSFVRCAVWNGLFYGTRRLDFAVATPGRITYFGHLRFALADEDTKKLLEAVSSGVAGVPVGSVAGAVVSSAVAGGATAASHTIDDGDNQVTVEDRAAEAVREYHRRYRETPKVLSSLAGAPPSGKTGATLSKK